MLRAFSDQHFPRFLFHDGVFEQLEPRKKLNLLRVLREHARLGLQPIVTALDSDLPSGDPGEVVRDDEIVLRLHDQGEAGRYLALLGHFTEANKRRLYGPAMAAVDPSATRRRFAATQRSSGPGNQ